MFARNLTAGTQSKLRDSEANCGATCCNLRRDYLHGIRYKRRDSLFESREIPVLCAILYWSPATVYTLVCHTRLKKTPAGQREEHERERGRRREGGRSRSRAFGSLFSFPGHRQNKYPAIFAMHLLLLPPLSLSFFLFFSLFSTGAFPSSLGYGLSLSVYFVVCTLPPPRPATSTYPYHTIHPHVYSLPGLSVPECTQGVPELLSHLHLWILSIDFEVDCFLKEILLHFYLFLSPSLSHNFFLSTKYL